MSEQARLHAMIEGHVQGVGFRMFVSTTAHELGLTGWVRNRWNGDVEVLAEGERAVLESFLSALYKGPRSAYVMKIIPEWLQATGDFNSFYVRSTA